MGANGNGHHLPAGRNGNGDGANATANALLASRSVQDLLAEFEATGRQEPFAEIVRRYAGMVYNVCYQVSRDAHDAEDATQAVFLTLAVRSKTAQKIQYLGPWLQRVAQRLSLDMKRSQKRRSAREIKHHDINVGRWEENNGPVDLGMDELRGILRDEIDKLPAKYRMPLILHYFGGLKPEELSKELGIKANTLGVRLHRARKMLAESLERRGIAVGGAMLAAALASMIPYYVQSTVVSRTASAAAAYAIGHQLVTADVAANVLGLMQASQRAAIMAKVKAVTAAVAVGVAGVAGGAEFLSHFKPFGLEFRNPLNLRSLVAPLFERLRSPVRFSSTNPQATPTNAAVAAQPTRPAVVATPTATEEINPADDARASLASRRTTVELQRDLPAAPLRALELTTAPFTASPVRVLPPPIHPPATTEIPAPRWGVPMRALPPTAARGAPNAAPPIVAPTAAERFAAARVAYVHTAGALSLPTMTLDSGSSHVRSMTVTGGSVAANRLVVGEGGIGELRHSGGSIAVDELAVAVQPGSTGAYTLDGASATLQAESQRIGIAGQAAMTQSTGSNTVAGAITLGEQRGGEGVYAISGGTLDAGALRIGIAGKGEFRQSAGSVQVRGNRTGNPSVARGAGTPGGLGTGSVYLGEMPDAVGLVDQSGGSFASDSVVVGLNGTATYVLRGGEARATVVLLGAGDDAAATFRATHGTIVFGGTSARPAPASETINAFADASMAPTRAGRAPGAGTLDLSLLDDASAGKVHSLIASGVVANALIVGNGGDAVVQLGNRTSTAQIIEASPTSATPVINGASPSAKAEIIGWGTIGLRGPLVQNGRLVADSHEKRGRSLDLSSLSRFQNTIENPPDGDAGQYAQRLGRLVLPPIHVSGDGAYNWGESPDDTLPDLVNSVRFDFSGVNAPGDVTVSLLAPEWAEREPGMPIGQRFLGLWKVDADEQIDPDTTDLLVRYDAGLVQQLGLLETDLELWAFDNAGRWVSLARELVRLDTEAKLIGGAFDGIIDYFAVSIASLTGPSLASPMVYTPQGIDSGTVLLSSVAFEETGILGDVGGSVIPADLTRGGAGDGPAAVPEPGSLTFACGAAAMLLARRRRAA